MKKELISILFTFSTLCAQAQVILPTEWDSYVKSENNHFITDTFRTQTFKENISDNWAYTSEGDASLHSMGLRIQLGTNIHFDKTPLSGYKDVYYKIYYALENLVVGENINMAFLREGKTENVVLCKVNNTISYEDHDIAISRNPEKISFFVLPPASKTKNGVYYLKSIYAFGDIQKHSLFQGDGSWNNSAAWSHLPPARRRDALIKGDVYIDTDVQCNNISIDNGSLQIKKASSLHVNNMYLYNNTMLSSSGDLELKGTLTFTHNFSEKGKWFFISFPFDVYRDGIDAKFILKDDTTNDSGDYLYAQEYDGEKRSSSKGTEQGWSVIPQSAGLDGSPVFEKNKGYLIAIDEQASNKTIFFSSKAGDISSDFGAKGTISIDVPIYNNGDESHNGWVLCGNPLPAPLHISQLNNPMLDGYVYSYDGEKYTAISFNKDYAIPPFSAFFLKAKQSVDINVNSSQITETTRSLPANIPFSFRSGEPKSSNIESSKDELSFFVKDKILYIENSSVNGHVRVFDIKGRIVYSGQISKGGSKTIPLSNFSGIYVLELNNLNCHKTFKFLCK